MAVLPGKLWALSICCLLFSSGTGTPSSEAAGTDGGGGGMGPALCNTCPTTGLDLDVAGENHRLLLEVTKRHILSRLHMKNRPNVTSPIPRSALMTVLRKLHAGRVSQNGSVEIVHLQQSSREDQSFQIISFPEAETTGPGKAKLRFQFLHEADQNTVTLIHQANLWLYVKLFPQAHFDRRSQRRTVKVFVKSQGASSLALVNGVSIYRGGWHMFPVTQEVQNSFDGRVRTLTFDVECEGCGNLSATPGLLNFRDDSHQPFLVARTRVREGRHRIHKRGIECNANTSLCCRKEFYLDFRVIGWDDWIIAPVGYYGNYCVGSCPSHMAGAPGTASSFHTAVFNLYKVNGDSSVSNLHSCCIPTRLNGLSMLYFDGKQNIVKRDIPDMVVEECGCT
ncbi:inhibin beta B chain-like [Callorhinchus milii]|uniref:inhibin beta B chain-like n=1 Tax=Callorhinchus milii TaxID=7868 RepID=UPI001C3F8D47|nr:inhibin beta B chain-like [Callorhinchus milii]